ncbi:hypothetical protein DL96DRAFT_1620851 [Flagelloscypha sp. PMI_526]|nr:hypothetical protein DL96DRAFT_1620851 [Flagelloscypha sp. PMI_526]
MLSFPSRPTRTLTKRPHSLLDDSSPPSRPPKRVRRLIKVLPEDEVGCDRVAHIQTQSALLHILPAEILDSILGDLVLNERDHIALSGTCTLLRLGYTEEVWQVHSLLITAFHKKGNPPSNVPYLLKYQTMIPSPPRSNAFRQTHFTSALLSDPCNVSQCLTIPMVPPTAGTPRSRIFSTALSRTSSADAAGINLKAKCANPKHKRKKNWSCLRFEGPSHEKIVRGVNTKLTAWGRIEFRYQSLSTLIDPVQANFRSVLPASDKHRESSDLPLYRCYCLATVDAAIWKAAGGATGVKSIWESHLDAQTQEKPQYPRWRGYMRVRGCCGYTVL